MRNTWFYKHYTLKEYWNRLLAYSSLYINKAFMLPLRSLMPADFANLLLTLKKCLFKLLFSFTRTHNFKCQKFLSHKFHFHSYFNIYFGNRSSSTTHVLVCWDWRAGNHTCRCSRTQDNDSPPDRRTRVQSPCRNMKTFSGPSDLLISC